MSWKDSYNDICNELRILQIHEMELRKRVELAHDVVTKGEIPSSGPYCHIPLDKSLGWYDKAVAELNRVQDEVDRLNGVKVQMESAMEGFTDLGNRIMYERLVNGKKYKEIASELGYTEQYMRKAVWQKGNKLDTQSTNAS